MSNYSLAISIVPEPQRSLAFGSISGTYAGIGTSLDHPARIIMLHNDTDALLQISENGIDDHYVIAAQSGQVYDLAANQAREAGGYKAAGTRFYVKTIGAPTAGSIYLSAQYGFTGH